MEEYILKSTRVTSCYELYLWCTNEYKEQK